MKWTTETRPRADCKAAVEFGMDTRDIGNAIGIPQVVSIAVPIRCSIRRAELRKIVPLSDTTIYDMERRGDFPRRFYLTSKCVVWDLDEVQQWLATRRQACEDARIERAPYPDVGVRRHRPIKPGLA